MPAHHRPVRHPLRLTTLLVAAGGAASVLAMPASGHAHAGLQPEIPSTAELDRLRNMNWGVVISAGTVARCGPTLRYYGVATLDEGAFVRIVGQRDGATLIAYPEDAGVIVDARSVADVDDEAGTLALAKPSTLRAFNAARGLAGSWRSALAQPLPAGTELDILEVLTAPGSETEAVAYRVATPDGAVAYIPTASVRAATPQEIDGLLGAITAETGGSGDSGQGASGDADPRAPDNADAGDGDGSAEVPSDPAPEHAEDDTDDNSAEGSQEPASDAGTEGADGVEGAETADPQAADSTNANTGANTGATDTSTDNDNASVESGAPTSGDAPGTDPADETASEGGNQASEEIGNEAGPADDSQTGTATTSLSTDNTGGTGEPAERPVLSYAAVTQAFQALRASPEILDDALDELIAEHERTLATLTEERERVGAGARLEWLRLKRDIRDRKAELARVRLSTAQDDEISLARLAELEQAANDFAIVGLLVASRVYDGNRLPLMYRVVSIDPVRPGGTLGYVRPDRGGGDGGGPDLEALLGRVVGASGVTRLDPDLGLRIIQGDVVQALPELEN